MQVYHANLVEYVPEEMIQALGAFLKFRYLVHRSTIDKDTLDDLAAAVEHFNKKREIFREVRGDLGLSLPFQCSMVHYVDFMWKFGAQMASITEPKHIKAVKQPYRRSSKNNALCQMLLMNQRLNKLHRFRVVLQSRNMLSSAPFPIYGSDVAVPMAENPVQEDNEDSGAVPGERVQGEVRLDNGLYVTILDLP